MFFPTPVNFPALLFPCTFPQSGDVFILQDLHLLLGLKHSV